MSLYTTLPLSAQTAYAQLVDAALAANHARTVADLPGSFAHKTVKGRRYVYFQYREPSGRLRQIYVGPDNEQTRALMAVKSSPGAASALGPLARAAVALGCQPILGDHFKVLRRLADYGFFRAGGVLIGTHAYLAAGNLLGVRWGDANSTQDIDFAHAGKRVAIALPSNVVVPTHDAINSLGMGLLPITALSGKSGARYLNPADPAFCLDFLAPQHRDDEPYVHPQIGITLQPLKFMEYLLEDVHQAVVFCPQGTVVASIPNPARYAMHKLLVYGERCGPDLAKAPKDLRQAASILSFYLDHREWEIFEAWNDMVSRGPGWMKRAHEGLRALARAYPALDLSGFDLAGADVQREAGPRPNN